MLVTAGLNDPRVAYWEPAKFTARLRALKTDANRLLLKTNMGAGHGGASGRWDFLREVAFKYAFVLDVLGMGYSDWITRHPVFTTEAQRARRTAGTMWVCCSPPVLLLRESLCPLCLCGEAFFSQRSPTKEKRDGLDGSRRASSWRCGRVPARRPESASPAPADPAEASLPACWAGVAPLPGGPEATGRGPGTWLQL